jgi:predicted MFS family arabinose efflux permease
VLLLFGIHATVWTVVTVTLRQERVDAHMLGRVSAAYLVFSYGGSAIGTFLGGFLVRIGTLTTPMWVGFTTVLILVITAGPRLGREPTPH